MVQPRLHGRSARLRNARNNHQLSPTKQKELQAFADEPVEDIIQNKILKMFTEAE